MNNDLESLFRSSFNTENISIEDWNIPSDKVWNGIEVGLVQKKKRKFLFFWFLPFVITSGMLVFFLMQVKTINSKKDNVVSIGAIDSKSQVNKENNKTISTDAKIVQNETQVFDNQIITNKKDKYNIEKKILKTVLNQEEIAIKNIQNDKTTSSRTSQNTSPKSVISKLQIETKNQDFIPKENNTSPILIENMSSEIKQKTIKIKEKTIALAQRKLNLITIPVSDINIAHVFEPKLEFSSLKKVIPSNNYSALFSFQSFFVKNKINGTDKVDFSGEKFNLAYNYGVSGVKNIGKKSFFSIGLQQSVIEYSLNYNVALPFNQNGEILNKNGNFDNRYNGAIPTSQGELKMEMVLQRQAKEVVTQGEAIPIIAAGKQKLKFFRIPFSIGTSFFNIGKLQIINQLSFNQMINTNSETTFQSILSKHSAVQETQTIVLLSPKPRKWTPELGTSLGLYYPINHKIMIGTEAFFNQSLRPMYKNNSYSNTPISYGFGANLKYQF